MIQKQMQESRLPLISAASEVSSDCTNHDPDKKEEDSTDRAVHSSEHVEGHATAAHISDSDATTSINYKESLAKDSDTISSDDLVRPDSQGGAEMTALDFLQDAASSDAQGRCGIDLQWQDIQCFVAEPQKQNKVAKWFGIAEAMGPATKQIIRGASGFARSGEVLALMGPSGSGKTTLLNVLAQRPTLGKTGYWNGKILLNGQEPWKNWERDMSYVMQKDIFYDELKVYENLLTTALLRLPQTLSRAQKIAHLDDKMKELGLLDVKDTKIGTAVDRGLSGGEVKRASIANETLALPRIFLLDEPLTGLDSSRAVDVMKKLKRLASENGTTVMLTIHQPSSSLYACFDRLLMLGKGGRTCFFGDVADAVPYFTKLGYPLPHLWAPSDHFIELLAVEETRDAVCDAWLQAVQPIAPEQKPRPESLAPMPTFTTQVVALLPRSFKRIHRSYLRSLQWKMQFFLALTWAIVYWKVGRDPENRIEDYVGVIFFIVAHWSWTPLFQGLGNFPREKEMLTKERASKLYEIRSFFVSQVLAEAPVLLVFPVAFFAIIWPPCALPVQVAMQVFVMIALNIQVCSSMSMLISALCMDADAAISVAVIVMVFQMCTGGYFCDMRQLPPEISWIQYTSFYYYTFGAVMRLMVAVPYGEDLHEKALERYSFSEMGYLWEILILLFMVLALRTATYIQLRLTKKLNFS